MLTEEAGRTRQQVLVVDDSANDAALLKRLVESAGHAADTAGDCASAILKYQELNPDVVLLDINLPDGTGFDILTEIRKLSGPLSPSAIFVTAHHDHEIVSKAFAHGAADYVAKPFLLDEVRARINVHLRVRKIERELLARNQALVETNERLINSNAELAISSRADALTALLNHRAWREEAQRNAERAARLQEPFSIVLFDVDNLKAVNDALGHACGDDYLAQVAACVRAEARGADLPGRYGGEELVVLCSATPAEGALKLAERVRRSVAELHLAHPASSAAVVTVSAGVADGCSEGWEAILKSALEALQAAKREGGNRVMKAGRPSRAIQQRRARACA